MNLKNRIFKGRKWKPKNIKNEQKHKKPKKNQTGGHSRVRVYSDFQFSIEKVNALCLNFDVSKAILCSLMFT